MTFHSYRTEEARISAAYSRRKVQSSAYSWSNPAYVFAMQEIERSLLTALSRAGMFPLARQRILEVGCGNGYWLGQFVKWGAFPVSVSH